MTTKNMYQPLIGFTIIELVIVIVVIGILTAISVGQFAQSAERGRDNERQTDMLSIKSHLEEYYQDRGGYPVAVNETYLTRLHSDLYTSPNNEIILSNPPVSTEYDARNMSDPELSAQQYTYTPYPTGCTTHCKGYILKSVIEQQTASYSDPYILSGTYNN